ncbi:MAG: hypothetical protein IM653_01670 [Phenylobacterium sp.]|uniref:hypothetical protein n=1 Tax=Phenylobacterium sp. TaxID=1871053 RepID=UPI0025CD0C58|nr:hypothetical protein [Phenylobacterium sp.]MCA6225985.1 hypothetical protein [Phenylobacterium sp.]MCA6233822.1 hypothetical protein [Phenylobacterium sp.]MCA6248129.1 hypothetical protein [Phenylobacterium sp.]MCA6253317.1 hypothetical protein [Phenylobacterium sp.]MCA6268513.1 hypothetical protein [Phenylobacterium sp.]
MTKPIDPILRTRRTRAARSLSTEPVPEAPTPNSGAGRRDRVKPPPEVPLAEGAAALSAHLIGQDGAKRGLRGGPPVLDAARSAYQSTEWSGGADRRKKSGRKARIKT